MAYLVAPENSQPELAGGHVSKVGAQVRGAISVIIALIGVLDPGIMRAGRRRRSSGLTYPFRGRSPETSRARRPVKHLLPGGLHV